MIPTATIEMTLTDEDGDVLSMRTVLNTHEHLPLDDRLASAIAEAIVAADYHVPRSATVSAQVVIALAERGHFSELANMSDKKLIDLADTFVEAAAKFIAAYEPNEC